MATKTSQGQDLVDLHHDGKGGVWVYPQDYDAFIMSQRDAVEALSQHKQTMSRALELREQIQELFVDIADWGRKRPPVARIVWAPRTDDVLVVVIIADEDARLHEDMASLDLDLSDKYPFRINFLLLRASEETGLDSFIKPGDTRSIYNAESRSTPCES